MSSNLQSRPPSWEALQPRHRLDAELKARLIPGVAENEIMALGEELAHDPPFGVGNHSDVGGKIALAENFVHQHS